MNIKLLDVNDKSKSRVALPFAEYIEMTSAEQEFILILLERYKPKKIVEIGCAAGGTSALLLKNTGQDQIVYGIDISSKYYRDTSKDTSYLVKSYCSLEEQCRYKLYLGKDPIYQMDNIGSGIDFIILDTMHSLPGELLTFFAVYKYLAPGAVLILHDLTLNFERFDKTTLKARRLSFCTNVVFTNIGSRMKFLPDTAMPNIGAVIIDDFTEDNIESMFMALSYTWAYFPIDIIYQYKQYIDKNYSEFCQKYFANCIVGQAKLAKGVF